MSSAQLPNGTRPEYAESVPAASPIEYWRMLRRRKGTLAIAALIGALAGVLFTFPQTPIYRAEASIEIQGFNENLLNTREVDPNARSYSAESDLQTQIEVLQSTPMIERTLAKLNSQPKPAPRPDRVLAWRKILGLAPPKASASADTALSMAAGTLKVRLSGLTRIVRITSESTDPMIAADFANTLAKEFIEQSLQWRWSATQHTGDWLTRQLADMKSKLEKAEDELQRYAAASNLMFTGENSSVAEQKLRQLQAELSVASADRIAKQARYEMARDRPESLSEILNNEALVANRAKVNDLQRQLAQVLTSYTPAHYKAKQLQAQIDSLESVVTKDRGDILKRIRSDYEGAVIREKLLAQAHDQQSRLVSAQSNAMVHYNILKGEAESSRQLYNAMLQKVKEYGIASAMQASNIRFIDPAQPPGMPYKPRLRTNAMYGLMLGLLLGGVFVIIRERADRTLQEPGEAPSYVNLPELGVIPSIKNALGNGAGRAATKALVGPMEGPDTRIELVTWQRKRSMLAEAYRTTLTSILFAPTDGVVPRMLAITSPMAGEGKTTVLSNIGIALTEIRYRVLLIDADLRKPRLHNIFQVDNTFGLSDLLRDERLLNDLTVKEAIHKTMIPGLFVLPRGSSALNISNLIHSPRMVELLRQFRTTFDMVLIDTPPMLQISDARVIGRLVDGMIVVFRSGKTTRDIAAMATQRLTEDGIPVLGTILNDWDIKRTDSYGYGAQYYEGYAAYTEEAVQTGKTPA